MADAKQVQQRRDTTANLASKTPAANEHGFDTTRLGGLWGDGVTQGGIPYPNFAELLKQSFTYFEAVSAESPDDPNELIVTIDSRFALFTFAAGFRLTFKVPANNTGAVNLTISWTGGSTTKAINKVEAGSLTALEGDELVAASVVTCVYNGSVFILSGGASIGGGYELVEAQSVSDAAQVDFVTGLVDGFDYDLRGANIKPRTDNTILRFRLSTDGGSTFESTAVYRYGSAFMLHNATAFSAGVGSAADSQVDVAAAVGSNTDEYGKLSLRFDNPATVKDHVFESDFTYADINGSARRQFGVAMFIGNGGNAVDIDAIRLFMSSGNIDGDFSLWRRPNA